MSLLDKASLVQIPSGYGDGKLYSVVPDSGAGDFDFSRSSSATRVNSEGLIETPSVLGDELVTNGDFNTNSDWILASGATISDGKLNLNVGGGNGAYQVVTFTAQTTSKVVVVCSEYVSGSLQVRAGTTSNTETISGVGTYIYYLPYASYPYVNFFSSGGFEGKIDSITVKELVENDVPRLDYSGGASCASLLLEPQSTNLVTQSETFSNWGTEGGKQVVTQGVLISPDGTLNGNKLETYNSTNSNRRKLWIAKTVTVGASYTFSVYIKQVSGQINSGFLHITTGANDTFDVSQAYTATDQWQRVSVTTNSAVSSQIRFLITGDANSQIYIWGGQVEQQSYPTSYIPTSGSTTTRTADVCNNAGTSATFNDSEGVLFAEIAALADDLTSRVISLNDGSTSNRVIILYQTTTSSIRVIVSSGGSIEFDSSTQNYDITDVNKIALKYKENDFALWINGTEVSTDTSGLTPIGLNNLEYNNANGTSNLFGKCKQLIYFNEALSDEELATLTTL